MENRISGSSAGDPAPYTQEKESFIQFIQQLIDRSIQLRVVLVGSGLDLCLNGGHFVGPDAVVGLQALQQMAAARQFEPVGCRQLGRCVGGNLLLDRAGDEFLDWSRGGRVIDAIDAHGRTPWATHTNAGRRPANRRSQGFHHPACQRWRRVNISRIDAISATPSHTGAVSDNSVIYY